MKVWSSRSTGDSGEKKSPVSRYEWQTEERESMPGRYNEVARASVRLNVLIVWRKYQGEGRQGDQEVKFRTLSEFMRRFLRLRVASLPSPLFRSVTRSGYRDGL